VRFAPFLYTIIPFPRKVFKEVLFKVVELVEEKASLRRSPQHNVDQSCTMVGNVMGPTTLVSLLHIVDPSRSKKTSSNMESKLELTLLACSPLANIEQEDSFPNLDEDIAETTKFNAETHVQFFKYMLCLYKLSINSWVVCSIADNCSTNKKIAQLMGKPPVGCMNHKLGLEVNRIVENHGDLSNVIETTHETMRAVKQKLKNAALL
jgi:hypothetical protein